jgi:adenylosuccinate synthase
LQAKAGHQTLLIEGKSLDAAMQSVGGQAAGHSFVHNDNAWTSANLPAGRIVYPVHCILVYIWRLQDFAPRWC